MASDGQISVNAGRGGLSRTHKALRGFYGVFLSILFLFLPVLLEQRSSMPHGQGGSNVDLALVLGVDCSYSVDSEEFRLQAEGLARAFQDPEVLAAISKGPYGRIAVSVVQWSDIGNQDLVVPWTMVHDTASALSVSGQLTSMPRLSAIGATSISGMMRAGMELLRTGPYKGLRNVIDISSDGRNNTGPAPRQFRQIVAAQGITINGLAILNEVPTLDKYFELYVVAGPANFVMPSNNYSAFADAIRRKILKEVLGATVS